MNGLFRAAGVVLLSFCIFHSISPVPWRFYDKDTSQLPVPYKHSRSDEPDQYARYFQEITTMVGKEGSGYPLGYRMTEILKAREGTRIMRTQELKSFTWDERGPVNVPGRTRGLIISPLDPSGNTWITGTAGGGIWKTVDGGLSWQNKTPNLPNLATTVLAFSVANPSIIYAGTGEGFFNSGSIDGDGIFKSVDNGETWQLLSSTSANVDFRHVNRIVVDPSNPDILLACSNAFPPFTSGILKSTNGGLSWTEVFSATSRVQQLITDPSDFNIQYATLNGQGIIKSTDAGDSWFGTGVGLSANGRIELGISPTNTQRLFAAAESELSGTGSDVFVSDDAGASWMLLSDEDNLFKPEWLGDQGWYNNSVLVHPTNENIVYVGGIDLYKANVLPDTVARDPQVTGVTENGTQAFMDWINAGLPFLRGGLGTGFNWFEDNPGYPISLNSTDFVSVEIRFGPGLGQSAHRFTVPGNSGTNGNGGAGVDPLDYQYQDYVQIPFEAWDIDNNRQLMVSFRDQERDGAWNLIQRDPNNSVPGREYIFIHPVDYNPGAPDSAIARNGGYGFKTLYSMWPTLAEGVIWDENNVPNSKLVISYGPLIVRKMNPVVVMESGGVFNPAITPLHPDIHNIQSHSTQSGAFRLILATDGGMYRSIEEAAPGEDPSDWTHSNFGYNTTQFYSADKAPETSRYIGGTQDNGTWVGLDNDSGPLSLYAQKIGGDGFGSYWNYKLPGYLIGSAQYNRFRRSVDGGNTWELAIEGLDDVGEDNAPFFTTIAGHKKIQNILYAVGKSGVWRSGDFAESWSLRSISGKWTSTSGISSAHTVTMSLANPSFVWAGGGMTSQRNLHLSTNGGIFFRIVPNIADTLGSISSIATHPAQDSTAYVLFSFHDFGKIFRTTDLGQSWEEITGFNGNNESSNGFPDVSVYSLLVLPHATSTIWVGTEIGIFESNDDGASWHIIHGNFPATAVWQLRAVDDQVIAATHGRGIWTATLPGMQWPNETITSVEERDFVEDLTIYPNPADDEVVVQYNFKQPGPLTFSIIHSDGRLLDERYLTDALSSGKQVFDLRSFPNGVVILTIAQGRQKISRKILIRH